MSEELNRAVRDLQRLIAVRSVKSAPGHGAPFGAGIRAALDETMKIAARLGFTPVDVDGYAGYCEIPCSDPTETVGVLSHLDVVPIGEGWTHAQGELQGGKIYGRGAADDKGPTVACLYALKRLKDAGFTPRRNLRLIWGCDEESGSACMAYYARKIGMPDVGFSPDSDFPLVAFEKTILHLKVKLPLQDEVVFWEAGTRPNVVPDRSVCAVSRPLDGFEPDGNRYIRKDAGRSAHAMDPSAGESAVWKTANALRPLAKPDSPFAKFLSLCAADAIEILGIERHDDPTGHPTVNVGVIRTAERELRATFDLRCPLSLSADDAVRALSSYLGSPVDVLDHSPYLYADEKGELFQTLDRVYRETTGRDDPPVYSGGGTYARHMPCGVAFGPYLPGEDNRIHERDEFLRAEHLSFLIDIYARALRALGE